MRAEMSVVTLVIDCALAIKGIERAAIELPVEIIILPIEFG